MARRPRAEQCRLAVLEIRAAKLALKGGRAVWGNDEMTRRWVRYRIACAVTELFTDAEIAANTPVDSRERALAWLREHEGLNGSGERRMRAWADRLKDDLSSRNPAGS